MDERIYQIAEQIVENLYVYPGCIKFYIEAYWDMWEDENK